MNWKVVNEYFEKTLSEGLLLGTAVGRDEGLELGCPVGCLVGLRDGCPVGRREG